ncbi:phosphonate C-P lyase system protein PhnH [Pelagibacterium limicola]|uniref:phosphonate C-P lyase system protein PhnH n=1 Tax=Pelagibacterium limicola TaxID=2791022 RepID=UPI0018AF5B00|nr:phosphonate C-P lyase system protein PhnH [Pelagibacterium limicola]
MTPSASNDLLPGFADPVFDAQSAFRATLDAMSYPGRVQTVPTSLATPEPLGIAAGSLALALFDFDTPVWLEPVLAEGPAAGYLRFHCGCPVVSGMGEARFALVNAASLPRLDNFGIGEDRYPDRSATLVIAVPSLTDGPGTRWTGPGIDGSIGVQIAGLPDDFWAQWADNRELYPQGIDVIFTCGKSLVGLPRTINVEA